MYSRTAFCTSMSSSARFNACETLSGFSRLNTRSAAPCLRMTTHRTGVGQEEGRGAGGGEGQEEEEGRGRKRRRGGAGRGGGAGGGGGREGGRRASVGGRFGKGKCGEGQILQSSADPSRWQIKRWLSDRVSSESGKGSVGSVVRLKPATNTTGVQVQACLGGSSGTVVPTPWGTSLLSPSHYSKHHTSPSYSKTLALVCYSESRPQCTASLQNTAKKEHGSCDGHHQSLPS